MVVEHKHKIGFKGTILIEPKPHEPTKHQYDHDVETVYGSFWRNGLEKEVRLNIEANHATLAGHSFEHEIATAVALGMFGSIDMNRGDLQNGWDTDQFPNDVRENTMALYYILQAGGFTTGGNNFDAKVRRQSIDPADLFYAHIGGSGHGGARTAQRGGDDRRRRARGHRQGTLCRMAGRARPRDARRRDEPGRDLGRRGRRRRQPAARSGRQELIENMFRACISKGCPARKQDRRRAAPCIVGARRLGQPGHGKQRRHGPPTTATARTPIRCSTTSSPIPT